MNLPAAINNAGLAIRELVAAEDAFDKAVDAGFAAIQPLSQAWAWNAVPGSPHWQIAPPAKARIDATRAALSDARRKLAEAFTAIEQAAIAAEQEAACP
jgi:hypothetical protein